MVGLSCRESQTPCNDQKRNTSLRDSLSSIPDTLRYSIGVLGVRPQVTDSLSSIPYTLRYSIGVLGVRPQVTEPIHPQVVPKSERSLGAAPAQPCQVLAAGLAHGRAARCA